jgi:hypothetical protein
LRMPCAAPVAFVINFASSSKKREEVAVMLKTLSNAISYVLEGRFSSPFMSQR